MKVSYKWLNEYFDEKGPKVEKAADLLTMHSMEVEDMEKIANALVINIGTLSPAWIAAMKLAVKKANALNKPIVLDPVGAGATAFRNKTITELLEAGKFSVIRANASEIMSMVSAENRTKRIYRKSSDGHYGRASVHGGDHQ